MYFVVPDGDTSGVKNNRLPEYEFPDILFNGLPMLESFLFAWLICNTCGSDLFML